jgi:hypothetical protein
MTLAAEVLAWGAAALLVYVYAGYPLGLWILARLRPLPVRRADVAPSVCVVISAFNEARHIRRKLENALALDHPADRFQIVVVSDASTDDTDRIVGEFADRGVRLIRMPARGGKTVGLNAAMSMIESDIVIFSDANILYERDMVVRMLRNFGDPTVGCVTGDSRYEAANSGAHVQETTYWGYERTVRALESRIGSTVGGDGAIFAIRRQLYVPLPPEAINDLVTPLQVVLQGSRAIFEPEAIGWEASAGHFAGEFRRKRRIVNRSWRGIMHTRGVLDPRRVGVFAWQVWSHKICRWLVLPVVLAGAAGCVVAYEAGAVYRLGTWAFAASVVAALAGAAVPDRIGRLARLAQTALYFYLVNLAAISGILWALRGRVETVWVPERR